MGDYRDIGRAPEFRAIRLAAFDLDVRASELMEHRS